MGEGGASRTPPRSHPQHHSYPTRTPPTPTPTLQSAAATRVLEVLHSLSIKEANVSPWTRAYMVPILLVLLLLTPAIVVVGVGLFVLRTALLGTLRAIAWTHKTKSLWAGFQYAPGLVYA